MRIVPSVALIVAAAVLPTVAQQQNPFLGAWNLTGTGQDSANVYWLEIKDTGGTLSGDVPESHGQPRSARGRARSRTANWCSRAESPDAPTGPEYRAKIRERQAHRPAHATSGGDAPPQTGRRRRRRPQRVVNWIGARPADVARRRTRTASTPTARRSRSSTARRSTRSTVQNPNRPLGWTVVDGVASNQAGANNLVSKEKFTDFKIEAEYKLGAQEQQRHLPARPLRAAAARRFRRTRRRSRDLQHMAIYGRTPPSVQGQQARR